MEIKAEDRISKPASATYPTLARAWTAFKNTWRLTAGSGRYRPEAHYMRGPGPKWREKYGHLAEPITGKR
jgi:hypothetical protein